MSDGAPFTVARGGKGGWGNTHFATATRQVPRFARSGRAGEERNLTLELKMLADVGLVGYPNVGKSTLLSRISDAHPKVANYHFTTLSPNLGVVSYGEESFVVADIPGLVEGASDGVGLGHDFLRHIDRCRLIVHVVDISASERPDPLGDLLLINRELAAFSETLAAKPQIIAVNKTDLGYDEAQLERVAAYAAEKGCRLCRISAEAALGVEELVTAMAETLRTLPPITVYETEYEPESAAAADPSAVTVTKENGVYVVSGDWAERLVASVNFDDSESLQYFQRALRSAGVIDKLEQAGIEEGDTVELYGLEFDFYF